MIVNNKLTCKCKLFLETDNEISNEILHVVCEIVVGKFSFVAIFAYRPPDKDIRFNENIKKCVK